MIVFLILVTLFSAFPAHASSTVNVSTHVESNTDSRIEVNQNVSNTNSVYKKVEIEVNGEKHVYESDKPGDQTIKIESRDGKVKVENSQNKGDTNRPTPKQSPSVSISPILSDDFLNEVPQTSLADYIFDSIKEFFGKLFG